MTLFLSSSGNRIARRTTISLAVHDPASVVTLRLFATGQGLQCRGRHLREIKVTVDPGSNNTFNMVRDRTADMVSQIIMLSGVSLFLLGILAEVLFGFSLASELGSNTGKASSTMGLPVGIIFIFLLTDFGKGGAFPAVKVNGLLFSINPLIFLVLIFLCNSTAGATRHLMSRGSFNALSHEARKASSSSLSLLLLSMTRLSLRSF